MSNEVTNPASCQTAVMGSTHLIVLKDWITPYNSVKKGNHAPAYYWAEKLGKTEEKFIKDFEKQLFAEFDLQPDVKIRQRYQHQ